MLYPNGTKRIQPRPEGNIPNCKRIGLPSGVAVWWMVPSSAQVHPLSPSSSKEEGEHAALGLAFPSSPLLQERGNNGVSCICDWSIATPPQIQKAHPAQNRYPQRYGLH